jgi:hypothetical protein
MADMRLCNFVASLKFPAFSWELRISAKRYPLMGGERKNIENITRQGEMIICHQLSANTPSFSF